MFTCPKCFACYDVSTEIVAAFSKIRQNSQVPAVGDFVNFPDQSQYRISEIKDGTFLRIAGDTPAFSITYAGLCEFTDIQESDHAYPVAKLNRIGVITGYCTLNRGTEEKTGAVVKFNLWHFVD